MNKWQQTYIKQKLWIDDPFLVKPYKSRVLPTVGATKKCKACKKTLFSCEFANDDRFVDKKIPVCTDCIYVKKSSKAKEILNKTGFKKLCSKCRTKKPLGEFKVDRGQYTNNVQSKQCDDCMRQRISDNVSAI